MPKFYVVYDLNSTLADCYSVIESNSFMDARNQADLVTKGKYSFFYDARDFHAQLRNDGMKEIPLQPQRMWEGECNED